MENQCGLRDAVETSNSDEQLLNRLQKGEFEAVEELYSRYSRMAFALALRILNDAETAEDVVQEVFVRVWRQPGSYDATRGRFPTWLMSVTHNLCIDQVRKRKRENLSFDQEESQEKLNFLAQNAASLEEEIWANIKRDSVRKALDQLPKEQKHLLELAYFGGYTQNEIAKATGQPLGTVKSRIRLGLIKLKDILQKSQLGYNP